MYPLTLLSVCWLWTNRQRFLAVRPGPILQRGAIEEIDSALEKLDIDKAKSICGSLSINKYYRGGTRSAVDVDNYDSEQVKEAMDEASSEELAGPYVLINYLSVIGSLSPMVGLLRNCFRYG